MKTFFGYVLKTKDGKYLNPNFAMRGFPEITFVSKEELYSNGLNEVLKYLHDTKEDAEYNHSWYIRACEMLKQTPKELTIRKIQITFVDREL